MKLHIQYLRSLEESERVRKACLTYMRNWFDNFYPERPDIVAELQALAAQLQGHLDAPRLRWKYAWMKPIFGWKAAKWAQMMLPQMKASLIRDWDKTMYRLESSRRGRWHSDERSWGQAKTRIGRVRTWPVQPNKSKQDHGYLERAHGDFARLFQPCPGRFQRG